MFTIISAQILKLKHSVTKGDKKKKKDVADQIAKLEADLEARQKEELVNVQDKLEVCVCELSYECCFLLVRAVMRMKYWC